jgi:acetyl esterase/lipase
MRLRFVSFAAAIWLAAVNPALAEKSKQSPGDIVVVNNLPYRDGHSEACKLDLAMRKDRKGPPRPAIVVIHGGGWIEGDKSSFASREHGVPGNIVDFAALGFVAVTVNYRLSRDAGFPAPLADCMCAVRWLRAHAREYNIDPARIGAYGNSAGGHLALLLAMLSEEADRNPKGPFPEQSSRVQAAASDSGPIDLVYQYQHNHIREVVARLMGGPPDGTRLNAYKQASPLAQIARGTPPLLLIYGVTDEQVPVEIADQFVVALDNAGNKDVSYYRLANVGHCPHSLLRIPFLRTVVEEFFVRTLMAPKPTSPAKSPASSR